MRIALLKENVHVRGNFHHRRFCMIQNTNSLKQDLVLSDNILSHIYMTTARHFEIKNRFPHSLSGLMCAFRSPIIIASSSVENPAKSC